MYISLNTHKIDYEYYRIIQELKALGLTPSGNKSSDKARLQIEKNRLIKLAEEKHNTETFFLETLIKTEEENRIKNQLEEERTGATSLGELNKIFFKL